MYRREWLKTVEDFFREKNRAWLSAGEDSLVHYLAGTPADCHSWQEVRALREAVKTREVRYRKAKTNLQVLSAKWHEDGELAVVEALEHVRFYYEQGDTVQDEARMNRHVLTLMPFGGKWRLVHDETERERSMPLYRPDEPTPEEALAQMQGEAVEVHQIPRDLRGRYDRVRAYRYAELWWDGYNPAFKKMQGNDCTNYTSQVLFAGGMPMVHASSRSKGWWYKAQGKAHNWSFSWSVAHSLKLALPRLLHAQQVGDPRQLKIGDIICYDWDGDGRWQHNTVVVDFDYYGSPLVDAHTVASHRRYWDYRDSYAVTPRTKYAFYHIPDNF